MPKTVTTTLPAEGETLFDPEEKVFPDVQAEPGQKAFIFIHTVPYEGSVALVNLLASGTRGYPSVGQAAFPGHLAINDQIKTLLKEGAKIYACRFAMGALYGFREDDLIPGVRPFNPKDVLDSRVDAWKEGAFQLNTWTV